MLKRIIVKSNIIMLIALALFCIGAVSNATYEPETTVRDGGTRVLKSVRYGSYQGRELSISYEKLAEDYGIWCRQHGVFLTSEYSPSRPDKDATIEVNGMSRVVRELNYSNTELGRTRGDAYSVNPYGTDGSKYTDVYTIGKYKVENVVESRAADVFADVLSRTYEKSTSNYPNPVQTARWIILKNAVGGAATINDLNTSIANASNGGRDIAKAGLLLEDTIEKCKNFTSSHNGATVVNSTDYSKLKIGYDSDRGTVIVGPFKLNYVWSMYHPKVAIQGEVTNEQGDVEFSVIKDIKLYADDALRQEVKNFRIVYPDRDKSTQDYIKIDNTDSILYRYPVDGEEFYIEFNNAEYADINALNRMAVTTQYMTAEGTHEELVGTADHVVYRAKTDPIECTCSSTIPDTNQCILHPEHQVGDGHARAYTYSVVGEVAEQISTQPTYHPVDPKLPVHTNYVTMELGTPESSTWLPMIFPIPFGYDRDNEKEYVPVLPVDPDPNDPPTPPEPGPEPEPDPEIKLTFDIAGTVWLDDFLGKETLANGVKDESEKGMQNIIVRLYKDGEAEPVRETLTNENGEYLFQFVRIGYDYYVEFTYDGMTYTTTKYLGSQSTTFGVGDTTAINEAYRANPENYLNNSHAVEDYNERLAFNSKFMEISNCQAVGTAGIIPLSYRTYMSEQGAVSALITTDSNYVVAEPFQIKASTKTAGLMYLLDKNYVASDSDLNLTQVGEEYYYHATYPGTLHINLGLVKRERADFAVKNDVYQTIITKDENLQTYRSNNKNTNSLTYDAHTRNSEYYTGSVFTQKIDKADYNVRYDAPEYKGTQDISRELNAYIEYKFLIRNQSPVQIGAVLELTNHFDSNLEYATSYDFTNMTSWIETDMIDENDEVYREGITWEVVSTGNGYTTIKSTGLKDKVLISGETVELHLILKVKKDAARNLYMDLGDNDYKENVLEISKYTFHEGMIDRDSNPGSVVLNDYNTYEDDTDIAPFVKFVFTGDPTNMQEDEQSRQGKVISGRVWEDLVNQIMPNNLYTGNGKIDSNEKGIPDVKVELIQVLIDKNTGKEFEMLKQVGNTYSYRTDKNGEYKFTNLPSGMYKVKFTYGDETQLSKDITFNGQDYKSVSTDTLTQYFVDPSMEVMILADTSEGMIQDGVRQMISDSAKSLIESLYTSVQKVKIGATLFSEPNTGAERTVGLTTKPDKNSVLSVFENITPNTGTSLENAIYSSLGKYTSNAAAKVMVICTDGYISSNAYEALNTAAAQGVKVISVVDSTDVWTENTFGTEDGPTTGKLYNVRNVNIPQYITEVTLEDVLDVLSNVLPNTLQAKDVQKSYNVSQESEVGDIYTRQRSIDYTDSLVYENGSVVNGMKTTNVAEFAKNTQVTAITPIRNVMLEHNNQDTSDANLGLIERPRTELQIREEIAGIQVKLSSGEVIIDTTKDMTKNVQIIGNVRDNIYMDKEIMQGATLNVIYRVTVFNNGHVDTLGEYYDYDMYNTPVAVKYNEAVSTNVGTIYSYYTNLTFRPEENSNMAIEKNSVVTDIQTNGTSLANWESYIKENGTRKDGLKNDGVQTPDVKDIVVMTAEDGKSAVLNEKTIWEAKALIRTGVDDDDRIKNGAVKVVETNSLSNIPLYPVMSNQAISGEALSSVSTYIQFSKTVSPNDETDTMTYKQSVEIVEKLNDLGRRDYEAVPGNYVPHADITEYDSAKVADIYILPPFGENLQTYFLLAAGATAVLGAGVIFIRRKIVK